MTHQRVFAGAGPRPSDLIYHYTTGDGLLGIITSGEIWATRTLFLNDTMEVAHAFRLVAELLWEFERNHPEGTEAFRQYLRTTSIDPHFFVSCWSAEGDQLSQWRGYGVGNTNYSLGFSRSKLEVAANAAGWRFEQCVYEEEDQKSALRARMREFYASWPLRSQQFEAWKMQESEKIGRPVQTTETAWFTSRLFGWMLPLSVQFKNESFSEEKEWRLIAPIELPKLIEHRAGSGSLVPYTAFPLPKDQDGALDIHEVLVGPTPDPVRALNGVVSLLQRVGAWKDGREVRNSNIPYRAS